MSNKARRTGDDMEPELEVSEEDESIVADRTPKAPALLRLGRYRVVCELASGGMATVNLAIADGLDKLLALKVIHPHLANEESFLRMFLDEARIASSVSHRNVCNVFDYGEQDGRYFMAMDYLAGSTLRDVIRRVRGKRNKLTGEQLAVYVAYIIAQACEGLHAAHELRDTQGELMHVVHRDVSPHNLFVTYDGNVSVVDFGIARASDRLQQTATGVLKGKFSYMAPEQIRQVDVDRRADIWSLGVCLWEALTLKRLFVRNTQADTLMSVMTDAVKAPSQVDSSLPAALDAITLRALSRNPDERYATAREMGRELMSFCRDAGANIGPLEIELFMQELFPKELVQSKELVRRAKRAAANELNEHSLSLSIPYPTQSGAILRASLRGGRTGATPVSAVGYTGHAGSFPPPQTEPRGTTVPTSHASRSRGFLWGALFAATLAGGAYAGLSHRTQLPAPVPVASDDLPVALPAPAAQQAPAAIMAQPETKPLPAALETPAPARDAPGPQREQMLSSRSAARLYASRSAARARALAAAEPQLEPTARGEARPSSADAEMAPEPKPEVQAPAVLDMKPMESAPAPVAVVPPKPVVVAPKPAQPSPKLDNRPLDANTAFGNIQTQGSLGSAVVSRMLGRSVPLMRSCYQTAARSASRNDFAPLSVSFTIDEAGLVRGPKASAHALPGLSPCVTDALRRVRADQKPDVGTVKVEAQVSFRPL